MKPEPTDIDREATRLFAPAPGMRVFVTRARWLETGRIITSDDAEYRVVCESNASALLSTRPDALDTDDPATVGCMLAQVEDAAGESVEMVRYSFHAYAVWTCNLPGAYGWTRIGTRRGDAGVERFRQVKVVTTDKTCSTCAYAASDRCRVVMNPSLPTSTRWLAAEYLDLRRKGEQVDCFCYRPTGESLPLPSNQEN